MENNKKTSSKKYGKALAKIYIDGTIEKKNATYNQEWLLKSIKEISDNKKYAAIVVYINSPGGSVYESDEIYMALKKFNKDSGRPVYAYFASLAASGGYYIGCSANKIFANRNTLTGSIGVISGRFIDLSALLKNYGIKSEIIHTGKNKTMGNVAEPATKEQKSIMQTISDECYEQFTNLVAENRKLSIESVKKLADGRIYTAHQAKENGLIDEIATFDECIDCIKQELFNDKDVKVPMREFKYKKKNSRLESLIKGEASKSNILSALEESILGPNIQFPAFYWDGKLS